MESISKNPNQNPEIVDFSVKDFLNAGLANWYWFVASMVVCIGLALLYIYCQEPVYERSEEILIKDQDAGGGVGEIAGAFSSFGLVSSNTSVNNELISLTSPAIMYEVAKRLGLDMNFSKKGGLHRVTLYGKTMPVNVELLDIGEQGSVSFRMELHPGGGASLKKFEKYTIDGKEKYSEVIELDKGKHTVRTPIGMIKITPNPRYSGKPIDENLEIRVSKVPMQSTIERYEGKLNGDLVDQDAEVIGLSVKDVCVQRAVDILNMILTVYNENWIEDKNKMAIATSAFIDERLKVIQQELGNVDANIAQYRVETGTPSLVATAQLSLEKDSELNSRMVELQNQLSMARYMKDYLSEKINSNKVIPVNTGTGSEAVEKEIGEYNTLLLSRNNLVDNSSESNPVVQEYDKNLAYMREAIVNSIDNQITRLETRIRSTRSEIGKTEGKMLSTPTQALPLLTEERQQKVKESLYIYLLQKREENELSQTFTAYNTRVVTPPMGSLDPISPRKKLILAIAFVFGLAVPGVIIYMVKSGDTKVRSRKDLDKVEMPFAGEIPQVGKRGRLKTNAAKKNKSHKDEKPPLAVVEEGKRDVVNEAFRVIRSNMEFMAGKGQSSHVVMFTSFNPGSGKSFIAYNLALSFALKQKRVLLIDCDLRHGSSSMYVGMPPKGLTSYLTEATDDWKSLVVPVRSNTNLSILPIGKMPPNPAELLENGRLHSVIEQAKEDYDFIFLDCPPVNIVVDTQIVGQYADSTLFVVRAGLLEKSALRELDEFYKEKRFKHISLILNGTDAVHSRYYTYGNYQNLSN